MTQVTLNELSAQPIAVKDWVDYQSGSIVSRKIIQQPTGAITVFAFDAGQALHEHTAPFDALVQLLEGEVTITISGSPFQVKAGEVLLLPANQPHAVKAEQRCKMLFSMIRA